MSETKLQTLVREKKIKKKMERGNIKKKEVN